MRGTIDVCLLRIVAVEITRKSPKKITFSTVFVPLSRPLIWVYFLEDRQYSVFTPLNSRGGITPCSYIERRCLIFKRISVHIYTFNKRDEPQNPTPRCGMRCIVVLVGFSVSVSHVSALGVGASQL